MKERRYRNPSASPKLQEFERALAKSMLLELEQDLSIQGPISIVGGEQSDTYQV